MLRYVIRRSGILKKIVMHVKDLCRIVVFEWSESDTPSLTIKAYASFDQLYAEQVRRRQAEAQAQTGEA